MQANSRSLRGKCIQYKRCLNYAFLHDLSERVFPTLLLFVTTSNDKKGLQKTTIDLYYNKKVPKAKQSKKRQELDF